MTKIRLPYVDRFVDRKGTLRHYFRRPGGKRIPLPGAPGTQAWMDAYLAARDAEPDQPKAKKRGAEGTFDRLLGEYFESAAYRKLKAPTKRAYRLAMERLVTLEGMGHRRVDGMSRRNVLSIVARRADRPSAANDALKKLRILFKFAIEEEWTTHDPTLKIEKQAEGTHHTWTDEEIEAFEAQWPLGTVQRTAFALLLFTGQRVSDVARMAWVDVNPAGDAISVTQEKTGTKLRLALHPSLLEALAAWPKHERAILVTGYGKPFTVKGLSNKMADAFDAAGLPKQCVTHGLRKAAARILAEAGCTVHEIAAITGHKSLSEVERYTKQADQLLLSRAANSKRQAKSLPNEIAKNAQTEEKQQ